MRTFNQAGTWADALTLYTHAADVAPNSAIAQSNCAAILLQHERIDEAAPHAARAVEIQPDNAGYHKTYAIALQAQHR